MSATAAARKKRVWDVADFAAHVGIGHLAARRLLLRLNAKHGGRLLEASEGANRRYTFLPASLARLEPDYFSPIESLEFRMEEVEEAVGTLTAQHRRLAVQTGANTRQIAQLQLFVEKTPTADGPRRSASIAEGPLRPRV